MLEAFLMMPFFRQILILMYKNVCFWRRHWFCSIIEIFVPIFLFYVLVYSKGVYPQVFGQSALESETIYPSISEKEFFQPEFLATTTDLYYTPSNSFTDSLIRAVASTIKQRSRQNITVNVVGLKDEKEMQSGLYKLYYKHDYGNTRNGFGIVFEDLPGNGESPLHLKYKIRPTTDGFDAEELVLDTEITAFNNSPYVNGGFFLIYCTLNKIFLQSKYKHEIPEIFLGIFPLPTYFHTVASYSVISFFLPTITIASFIIFIPLLIKNIVAEKETGGKELMKMMGLSSWMTWFGWFLNSIILCCVSIPFITILMVKDVFQQGPVFRELDASILVVFLFLYCTVLIFFCFAISPLFSHSIVAMFFGITAWTVTCGIPEVFLRRDLLKSIFGVIHLFLPNAVLNKGWESIIFLEKTGHGVTWSNLFLEPADGKTFSLFIIFLIFTLQILAFGIITFILDAVCPGPFGVPKSLDFFLKPSYWLGSVYRSKKCSSFNCSKICQNENFEIVSEQLEVGIKLKNISKVLSGRKVVENVSLDFYKGQITVLLGHNGAGKTTIMSILTGMNPPSSGEVIVNSFNIFKNMELFRENLGLCLQRNLLFDHLSVLEHIIFFGMLKKLSKSEATVQGLKLLELFHFADKRDTRPAHLSAGMKRKLSLAIALIGGTKILMLDEPTSGMDPESRREIWDLLLTLREERTILITTHYLEEADALGDRIAIMDRGRIKCYGSSIFIKRLYGACYYLKVTRKKNSPTKSDFIESSIKDYVPEASLFSEHGSQLVFMLPIQSVEKFPVMLASLETNLKTLEISNLSVSCTSLEDVFLKASKEQKSNVNSDFKATSVSQTSNGFYEKDLPLKKITGLELILSQFKGLLIKKLKFTRRKSLLYLIFGVLPILICIVACENMNAFLAAQIDLHDAPTLFLDSKIYDCILHYRSEKGGEPFASVFQNIAKPPIKLKIVPPQVNIDHYLLHFGEVDIFKYFSRHLGSVEFSENRVKVHFNQHLLHSLPVILNLVYNSIADANSSGNHITTSVQSIFSSDPFKTPFEEQKRKLKLLFMWVVLFSSSIMTFAGSFILFPHTERVNKAKQLQLMTGLSPLLYWISSFLIDYVISIVVLILCMIAIHAFDRYCILSNSPEFEILGFTILFYGFVAIIFAYFCSFFQNKFSSSFFTYFIICTVLGSICACVIFNFQELDYYFKETSFKLTIAHYFLLLLPHYSISILLFNYVMLAWFNKCRLHLVKSDEMCVERSYWAFRDERNYRYGLSGGFSALLINVLFYTVLIICFEMNFFKKLNVLLTSMIYGSEISNTDVRLEEYDVEQEKDHVKISKTQRESQNSVLIVDNLQKKFSPKLAAVHGLSFVVNSGECFGVLGVNGAGKTTTFRMLTGEIFPTVGDCLILNNRLSKNRHKYLSHIGYCPQFDALNDNLTGREMLRLFATLRGVHQKLIEGEVNDWITELNLEHYKDRQSSCYSGGTKRKFSIAIALIGRPNLIVLDEPTSGVDPLARHQIWRVLAKCCHNGQSIIMTSHSMRECEEICSKLTIIVRGKMKCIGSIPYLKQKYGQGYIIFIKLKLFRFSKLEVPKLKTFVEKLFHPEIVLKDENSCVLNYHVTDSKILLSQLFSHMLYVQKTFSHIVEDFTISDTTLEQIFLAFARNKAVDHS